MIVYYFEICVKYVGRIKISPIGLLVKGGGELYALRDLR